MRSLCWVRRVTVAGEKATDGDHRATDGGHPITGSQQPVPTGTIGTSLGPGAARPMAPPRCVTSAAGRPQIRVSVRTLRVPGPA
jgi:hypothetical protein